MASPSLIGLAPEAVLLVNASMAEGEMMASPSYYIMRPETVESFFYLWRVTGDQRYRDWGWKCVDLHSVSPCCGCRVGQSLCRTVKLSQRAAVHGML